MPFLKHISRKQSFSEEGVGGFWQAKGRKGDTEGGKSGGVGAGGGEKDKMACEVSICPWDE